MVHNKLLAQVGHDMPDLQSPGIQVDASTGGVSNLEKIISSVIGILSVIAVIYFAIQIILAGYSFLSSQGDEKKLEVARTRLTNGILGLTIVIIALGVASLLASLLGIKDVFDLQTIFSRLTFN